MVPRPIAFGNLGGVVGNGTRKRDIDMEATQETTAPGPDSGLDSGIGPIGLFLIKTVIVSAAIVLSAWILLDVLDGFATRRMQQLEQTIRTATSLGGRQFWTKLEGELDKLADGRTDLPPEKKAKILSQVKAISDRWRPFLQEAAAAIEGDANKPQK
jgi:hypothetical protein